MPLAKTMFCQCLHMTLVQRQHMMVGITLDQRWHADVGSNGMPPAKTTLCQRWHADVSATLDYAEPTLGQRQGASCVQGNK